MATNPEHLLLLGEAMKSELGIIVETSNPELLRTKLYNARKTRPEFSVLKLEVSRTSPTNHLWIVKSAPKENPDG